MKILRKLLNLTLGSLLFTAIAGGTGYFVLRFLLSGTPVEVPELTGRSLIEAMRESNKLGLVVWLTREDLSQNVPQGWIISQEPEAGSKVQKGRKIFLVVSRGPMEVTVPDLKGVSLREGLAILKRTSLQVGEIVSTHGYTESSRVAGTNPFPGKIIQPGNRIHILIDEDYSIPWMIPDLSGIRIGVVERTLGYIGLLVEYQKARSNSDDIITGQEPPSGTWINNGARVTLDSASFVEETL